VRLQGSCLKVWDTASLMRQRPLLTVHDVLKHMQLEDGRLFMWRIADDAVVPAVSELPRAFVMAEVDVAGSRSAAQAVC
jgi:hypothetical protein